MFHAPVCVIAGIFFLTSGNAAASDRNRFPGILRDFSILGSLSLATDPEGINVGAVTSLMGEDAAVAAIDAPHLRNSAKRGSFNNSPAPMPLLGSTTANVGGATNIVVTGLPKTLTNVEVTWWNGNTSFDEAVASYGSYGRPSEYYIEASANGSTWIPLTHITGNTYNGRQFVFEIPGKGYRQIRLRIVSIVGTYAGRVRVSVHSVSNRSTDTYLLLGDSITSNCWAAANNAFPNEPLGSGVHAQRADRYPIVTEAGIPGLLASSPLSTTPYGIPAIRQWLKDFPAVKYVGISYGTNDANGNVPAATYCSNVRALVQEVVAAGKTSIIPTILASPSSPVQANAPAMNACLATLESQYPSIIKGPDLWKLFSGHSVGDGWFFDSLHPSLSTGCAALQNAWVDTIVSEIYPQ